MGRKNHKIKFRIQPDIKFNSLILSKLINCVMISGKKSTAESIVYGALFVIEKKMKLEPVCVLEKALEHLKPTTEVRSRRIGGANYQVPIEVKPQRATTLAMRWLIDAARKRNEKNMIHKLACEVIEASDEHHMTGNSVGKGNAIKRREDTHRMAEANKAFAHYKW